MGSISQAKALLKKHDHLLREGELFGKHFHKQVEDDTAKGSSTGILALSKARPDNRPSTSNSVPVPAQQALSRRAEVGPGRTRRLEENTWPPYPGEEAPQRPRRQVCAYL